MDYTQAPTSYTPSTNSTPTFGQSGNAVVALQQSINAKNANTPGYVPLKEDGLYGPKTYAAANANSNLITTSGPSRSTFTNNSNALQKAELSLGITSPVSNPPSNSTTGSSGASTGTDTTTTDTTPTDPILAGLDSLKTANDNATNSLISSTQATYQTKLNTLDKEFENYKGGLQLLGIQSNQSQATPDLLLGHIHQAALDQMDKVNALKAEEAKVIMDAKTAQSNNDFKTLSDKTARLKAIQTEKADAIKSVYDTVSGQSNTAKVEAHDIYDTLQTLDDTDKEAFIQAVAQKFNIPVNDLVTSLNDEQNTRTKTNLANENSQANLNKKLQPKPPGSTASTKAAETEISNALKTGKDINGNVIGNKRGSDGYVDPSVYIKALNAFTGTQKQFLSAFPVKGNVNPDSYSILPKAIQPTTKSGTSGSQTP